MWYWKKIFLQSIDFNIVFHDFVFIPKTYILLYPPQYHYNFCSLCFLIIFLCLRLYYTSILALLLITEVTHTKFQQYVCLNLSWTKITTSVFSASLCSWSVPLVEKHMCVYIYHRQLQKPCLAWLAWVSNDLPPAFKPGLYSTLNIVMEVHQDMMPLVIPLLASELQSFSSF